MFIGLHYHSLEIKGRLSIPKDFRQQLESGGVITRGLDGCLFLFPQSSWNLLAERLASLPLTNPSARHLVRLLAQPAVTLELDRQGRFLVPQHLQEIANLKKTVVVAGALTRIEIWDRETYHQHIDLLANNDQVISESLKDLGI